MTCSWCGHRHTDHPCHVTRSDKTKCPCTHGLRFVTHHIACTEGCTSATECTQPGEHPCPCHEQEDQ